jgi:hypothetical protein
MEGSSREGVGQSKECPGEIDLEALLKEAEAAAREAGAVIAAAFHKPKNVTKKALLDFVTDTGTSKTNPFDQISRRRPR